MLRLTTRKILSGCIRKYRIGRFLHKSYLRYKYKPNLFPPIKLGIECTNYCNLSCSYCPQSLISSDEEKGFLSSERLGNILKNIQSNNIRNIGFTGLGEPFLNQEWALLLNLLRNKFHSSEIVMATNGILLDYQKLEIINSLRVKSLTISLNAIDRKRYLEINRKDCFDLVYGNILGVVNKYSLSNNRYTNIVIQLLGGYNSASEIDSFFKKIEIKENKFIKFYVHPLINWGGLMFKARETVDYPCPYLGSSNITWAGDIYACCNAIGSRFSDSLLLGNLTQTSYEDIYRSEKFKHLYNKNKNGDLYKVVKSCAQCNSPMIMGNLFYKNIFHVGRKWI